MKHCSTCTCTPKWRHFNNTIWPHNKFWKVRLVDNEGDYDVVTIYGPRHTNGTEVVKHFSSYASAESYMRMKITEKLGRGYKEVRDW